MARLPTHAGTIVYRDAPDGREFLLVSSSRSRDERVLPKGHIEPGETPEVAAQRELAEEAGVVGDLLGVVGDADIVARDGPGRVRYFLARATAERPAEEFRVREWLPFERARRALSFDDARVHLDRAQGMIQEAEVRGKRP